MFPRTTETTEVHQQDHRILIRPSVSLQGSLLKIPIGMLIEIKRLLRQPHKNQQVRKIMGEGYTIMVFILLLKKLKC